MKLVHLIKRPLTLRDRNRFGIDFFRTRGDSVAVLDMSALLHSDLPSRCEEPIAEQDIDVRHIATWEDFASARPVLAGTDAAIFLLQSYGVSDLTYRPLRELHSIGVPYLTLAPNLYPVKAMRDETLRHRAHAFRCRLQQSKFLNSALSRLPPKVLGIDPSTWHVVNGTASYQRNNLISQHTKIIQANSHDFDTWLDLRHLATHESNQAIFIDQFMPHHIDAKAVGRNNVLDADSYYAELRDFFDWLENTTGLNVVIAAHPRSDYTTRQNPFGGRPIEYTRTAELIASSRMVLAHHSTAIGLAVLFRKAVAILTSEALMGYIAHHQAVYHGFAEALGAPLIYLDRPDTWPLTTAIAVDEAIYQRYESRFIRGPRSPERKMWEIIADAIS